MDRAVSIAMGDRARGAVAMKARDLLVLTVAIVVGACTSVSGDPVTESGRPGVPIAVDYRPMVSYVGALLYLLSHPGVRSSP